MKLQNLFKKKLDVLVEMRKQDKNSAIDEIGHMGIIVILYHMFDNHTAAYLLLGVYVFGILANAVRINKLDESIKFVLQQYENEITRIKYEKEEVK